jgi:beta-fructofuranosidase
MTTPPPAPSRTPRAPDTQDGRLLHRLEAVSRDTRSGFADHIRDWRFPEGAFLRDGFAPKDGCVWDFTIVRHRAHYHLLHIDGRPGASCYAPGNLTTFGHSSTPDFVTWTTHQAALACTPGAWDESHVWAPYVFRDERLGRWVMLYTGLNRFDCQQIGVAYSDDLLGWTKEPANPVFRPAYVDWLQYSLSTGSACRDPHVRVEDDDYVLYTTIAARDGRVGVAGCVSRDLVTWERPWPVYLTALGTSVPRQVESAAVHRDREGDRYLLFYTQNAGTHVVAGDNSRDFMGRAPKMIWETVAAVEVVGRLPGRWLVAGYRQRRSAGAYRLFLGSLDLAALAVREIRDPEALAPFLAAAEDESAAAG